MVAAVVPSSHRRRLPSERNTLVHGFVIGGFEGSLRVGLHADGTPGEVFIEMSKEGSTVSGLLDGIGILASLALQHGVTIEALAAKFAGTRFEPSGVTNNPEIPRCTSVLDYLFQYLALRFQPPPSTPPPSEGG